MGAARRSGRRGDEPRAATRVTRGSRGVSWWTCHGTWRETPRVPSGSRITRSGGALGPEDAKLWCAATPISAGVDASPPACRSTRQPGGRAPRESLPCVPRIVSLGRQPLRHRLRQQPRHPLPLVVAHCADDCLQPLRRHAALLTSGCGRGMRLWDQKYQMGVNTAIDKKLGQDCLRNPAPQNPKVFCLIPLWVITPSCRTPSQEICKRIPHNRCSCTSRRARRHDA